jgi:hypothetical protein
MYSMTVMKSNDEEALWTPSRVSTTNPARDSDSNPPPSVPVVMPMSWEYSTIESIVADLRTNEETYTFVLANFAGHVVRMNKWKDDALSGTKKPSEVMPISSEALLLLILLNYWKAWEVKANQLPMYHHLRIPPPPLCQVQCQASLQEAVPASSCTQEVTTTAPRMGGVLKESTTSRH